MNDFPFLSILTLLPLVGAVVVGLIPRSKAELAKTVALVWSLAVLVLSIFMWVAFKVGGDRFQFHESYAWIPSWDARFTFAADGIGATFVPTLVVLIALSALCLLALQNPPRPKLTAEAHAAATANPYRAGTFLWRIHTLSALLVVPQFTLTTFGLVWLVAEVGWTTTAAGVLVGISQFIGALGRIGVGVLSDAVGSRMRPLRWVAVSAILVMLALAIAGGLGPVVVAVVLVLATAVTVADNGLAFTAVAEAAGRTWSGRALGVQNTGQFLASAAVGPGVGAIIGLLGYAGAFASVALLPAAALLLIPRRDRSAD